MAQKNNAFFFFCAGNKSREIPIIETTDRSSAEKTGARKGHDSDHKDFVSSRKETEGLKASFATAIDLRSSTKPVVKWAVANAAADNDAPQN